VLLLIETSNSLHTILAEEIERADEIYSSAMAFCNTSVEAAFRETLVDAIP
jgi:hypothetical protein